MIQTPDNGDQDNFDYIFDYGVDIRSVTSITFTVRAANDATIALSEVKGRWNAETYEIVIGKKNFVYLNLISYSFSSI